MVHLPSGVFYDPHTAHAQATVLTSSGDGIVELEAAVGYTRRARREVGRQWWERSDEPPSSSEGLDLSEALNAALRRKAEEVQQEEPVRVSVDGDNRARVRSRKTAAEQAFREERTTVVLPVDVDALMKGDGLQVDVQLHVRYHPPLQDRVGEALPSILGPFGTLLEDIIPNTPVRLFHHLKQSLLHLLGHQTTPPTPKRETKHDVTVTLPPPTIFLACPNAHSVNNLFSASHSHLKPHFDKLSPHLGVVAQTKAGQNQLRLHTPVPRAVLLAPVQVGTLAVVVGAALVVVYHLFANVLPLVEGVERGM